MTNNNKITTRELCQMAIFTAVIIIMAQITIPMPLGVPMTMQTFAITLAAVILGSKKSAIATTVYILMGAVGLPVFAGFNGGIGALLGPTGGFIISFPIMAYIIGLGYDRKHSALTSIIYLTLGTISNYALGVFMFCILTSSSVQVGITACVLPFIPTAVIKGLLAVIVGAQIKKRLGKVLSPTTY